MASLKMLNEIENTVKSAGVTPTVSQPQFAQPLQPTPTMAQQALKTVGDINQKVNNIPVLGGAKRMVTAGLGKIGEVLGKPSELTEKFLTDGKGYEEAGWGLASTPARFILDPLNLLGVGLIQKPFKALQLASRAGKVMEGLSKIPKVEKAIQFAKNTPAIYKPIEATIKPYFRNPEAGKIIEAAKTATQQRVNQLFRQVSEASSGLDRTKQLRIGQLLEGGITTSKTDQNLIKIADQFKVLGEKVGKEMVDMGLLKPEQYAKYKGQYMHHFWDFAVKGENPFMKISDVPIISGSTQKFRSGAQGYVREFAPATFKGLGTSIKDIEAAKMYKQLASRFGISAPQVSTNKDMVSQLINELLKEYKPAKNGLGKMAFENTARYKESMWPVIDYLKKNLPARIAEGETRMGTKFKVGNLIKKGEKGVDEITGVGTPNYSYSDVAGRVGENSKFGDKVKLGQVSPGLIGPKSLRPSLKVGKKVREIPENFTYAPDELTRARGSEQLKDVALPPEVLDYIKRNQVTGKGDLAKVYDKVMGFWKAGKTIYNPAYHPRNLVSNQMLSATQTGRNMVDEVFNYGKAVKDYAGKVKSQFYNEAVDAGLIKRADFNKGVDELLNSGLKREGKLSKVAKAPAEFQQASEETAKLNVFTYFRKKGLSVEEAVKKAEEAIFSPYRLSQSERRVLGSIIPFYSFTRQAAPFIAKNLVKHPERFTKYPKMEQAVERLTKESAPDESNLPDYMKGMVRTPLKNKAGQHEYLNTQYLYPWGSFVNEGESGVKLPFGLSVNPIAEEFFAQKSGIDPYFNSPFVKEGQPKSEQTKARVNHAATTFLPSLYRSIAGKILPALQGKTDYQGRERDLVKTVGGELSGFKLYPYDTKQGAKTSSYLRYKITDDYNSERKSVLKDKSLTKEERDTKLKGLLDRRNERLKQLQK